MFIFHCFLFNHPCLSLLALIQLWIIEKIKRVPSLIRTPPLDTVQVTIWQYPIQCSNEYVRLIFWNDYDSGYLELCGLEVVMQWILTLTEARSSLKYVTSNLMYHHSSAHYNLVKESDWWSLWWREQEGGTPSVPLVL